jgi:hypothetical protein
MRTESYYEIDISYRPIFGSIKRSTNCPQAEVIEYMAKEDLMLHDQWLSLLIDTPQDLWHVQIQLRKDINA